MNYDEKPEDIFMRYPVAVVYGHITSPPYKKPKLITDYVLTCLVKEPLDQQRGIKRYPRLIRLTRREVERLKKTQGELEKRLSQPSNILENIQQKNDREKLRILGQNLRKINKYLEERGEIEPLREDVIYIGDYL